MTIAENLTNIRKRIQDAAQRCGRSPDSIKLIAVSKTKTVKEILEAANAGQLAFGENYAQELRDKVRQVGALSPSPLPLSPQGRGNMVKPYYSLEWHFIGHLQKNKIKYVLPTAHWIHTIDSIELLKAIHQRLSLSPSPLPLSHQGRGNMVKLNCLIEVNIAGEPSKSGIAPKNVFDLVKAFSAIAPSHHSAIALKGLMGMPTGRQYFKELRDLLNEINARNICPSKLTELSMGMSQDFEVAIEEGATILRVGTAIFGRRSA